MTKEEAYNMMQEGYPVSHTNFAEDEYLWMDENYIIKDEQGNDFENSWDVNKTDIWNTGWYIYKRKTKIIKSKGIPFRKAEESYIEEKQLISHIQGNKCHGNDNCLQYNMIGESACIMCDCMDKEIPYIEATADNIYLKQGEDDHAIIHKKKDTFIDRIKNIFRRKKKQ